MADNGAPHQVQGTGPASNDGNRRANGGGKPVMGAIAALCVIGVLLAVGILPRLKQNREVTQRAHDATSKPPRVIVIKPLPAPPAILNLPGSTQAIQDSQVASRTTGYVIKRYVDIGAHVHAGQVLAEIQSPDVDQQLVQANAQVAQSAATVQQAQADVANRLSTVAQYRANVQQAAANVETARAQLVDNEAKLAQLQAAEQTAEAQRDQIKQAVENKQAALRQANTQRSLARVTLERYETLLKSGYVALQDVDQNRANLQNAESAVNSAEADVRAATKAVDAAQSMVNSAQANVRSGEAQVRASRKNVQAVAATVNAAKSTVNAALAGVQSGQATVQANRYAQVANQANSKRFAVLTSFEKVTAPFDGVITARNIDVGALVNAGSGGTSGGASSGGTGAASASSLGSASSAPSGSTTPGGGLFGIARTDVLRILIPVPQSYARDIHSGLTATIAFNELPGKKFLGTVTNVSGALDAVSRTLLAEIHLPNADGKLLPGMFANVSFDLGKANGGLRVPATSVIFDALGTRVVLVGPNNKIHYQPVVMGRDLNTEVELTDGVTANSTLVASPSDELIEGEAIQPVMAPPPPRPTEGAGTTGAPQQAPPAFGAGRGASTGTPRGGNGTGAQ